MTMDFAPSFIKKDSLLAENHQFPDRRGFLRPVPEAAQNPVLDDPGFGAVLQSAPRLQVRAEERTAPLSRK